MEWIALTFCFASISTLVLACLWRRRSRGTNGKQLPPGSMGLPLIGETIQFFMRGPSFFDDRFSRYGNIYKTHLLGSPSIRVTGAEATLDLISKEPEELSIKWPKVINELQGAHSVPVVVGEEHTHLRKIVEPMFCPQRLNDYLPWIQEQIRSSLLSWSKQGRMQGFTACEKLMAEILTEIVLGFRKDNSNTKSVIDALNIMNRNIFSMPIKFPCGGYKKALDARERVTAIVKQRLEGVGEKDHDNLLDRFLTQRGQPEGMTDQQLLDNAVSLMMAGSTSSYSALCLCLLQLGKHPEVVGKIREELGNFGLLVTDKTDFLTYDKIQQLEYVHCVEKEILRILPPVGGAYRWTNTDIETKEFLFPKDWTVIYSIRDTHNTTEVFQDRDTFLPDRWKDKELENRLRGEDSCSYMPFGAGSRRCVGIQLARMIIHVFLIESARLVTWKLHNPNPTIAYVPVTMPDDLLPVTFQERPLQN